MKILKKIFRKKENKLNEISQPDQNLRDKISFGKLKFDQNNETIELIGFNESEKRFLQVLFTLNKFWQNNELNEFEEMIEKASDQVLCGLVGLYSELTDSEYEPLVHIHMIRLKNPQIDHADMYAKLTEDHRLRIYLRKIENYIVDKYMALEKASFNKCIDDWEQAEKAATKSGMRIMRDILISH
jgi:hypothetical protein